jgi:hypothetical protein
MPDTFTITLIFIAVCAVLAAFVNGRSCDRCLKDISGYNITIHLDNSDISGVLALTSSSMELMLIGENNQKKSHIFYKNEYSQIKVVVRYLDDLSPDEIKKRSNDLICINHVTIISKMIRRIRNIFGTVRDSVMELISIMMGRVKAKGNAASRLLQGQDKYVNDIQNRLVTEVGTAYEPVLEKYIGKKVVLEVINESLITFEGTLKDYTAEYIEVLDVQYKTSASGDSRTADIVVPRSLGVVRYAV